MTNENGTYLDGTPVLSRQNFKVPAENIGTLQERIDTVNKKVARLIKKGYKGVEPVVIEVSKPYAEKQVCKACGSRSVDRPYFDANGIPASAYPECKMCGGRPLPDRIFHDVTLVSPKAPKVDGWEFVAALTHVEGVGTVLRVCPGVEVAEGELARFRTASSKNCDHCHQERRRTDTFIVRKVG